MPETGLTRRQLLVASGVLATGVATGTPEAWAQETTLPVPAGVDLGFLCGAEQATAAVLDRGVRTGLLTTTLQRRVGAMAAHHREHAEALAELAGGNPGPNNAIVEGFGGRLVAAEEEPDVALVLLELVGALVATHMAVMRGLTDEVAYASLASLIPVGSRHAAVLAHAAGRSPTSETALPVSEPAADPLDPAAFPPEG